MREIKFRAWDKTSNRMDEVYSLNKGGLCQTRNGRYHLRADECVLMQFTGLHDKNGKEIYEGDVVRCFGIYDKGERISDDGLWEIYWRFDRWHLRRGEEQWDNGDYYSGDDVYWSEPDGSRKMEVIGNIYEHPELLSA